MTTTELKRKLAAILSADVKGYSRLMGEDEEWTVRTLNTHKGVIRNLVGQHRGRVVDSPGDNVLAEFSSVVDAVQCAVEIQQVLKAKNALLPETRRMEFRIGINLGDVIEEEDRIYGDGVNIAARLEGLAEPGGICISETAYLQIENKLPLQYDFMGEHEVKNIARPVKAYRARMGEETEAKAKAEKGPKREGKRGWRRPTALAVAAALVVLAGGVALWEFVFRPSPPAVEKADPKKMAHPLPDKPSIAVLPFVNMSGDPEQEYFSDGMTEDLITDLSKISGLFVIARNSTFVFKGKSVKISQVAEELGVRYVLEGSVRRAGEQVRINTQLIDATTGGHLWSERYDGSMKDIFGLQDKINQKIVGALAVKLTPEQKAGVSDKGTNNPAAYDELMKGREYAFRYTIEDYAKAEACYERAIELDPKYAGARAALARLYFSASNHGLVGGLNITWVKARLLARQYLRKAMKKPNASAYQVAAEMDLHRRQHDEALSQIEKALALDPNDTLCHSTMSRVLSFAGKPAEGMEHAKAAVRLDPQNPDRYLWDLGVAYFCMGKWEEAATVLEKALKVAPEFMPPAILLMSAYARLGRHEEARAVNGTYIKSWEDSPWSLNLAGLMQYSPFQDRRVAESFAESLLKVGVRGRLSDYIHVSKEDQLTEQDLRALAGSTIVGLTRYGPVMEYGYGSPWSFQIDKDGGKGIYRGPPGPLAEGTPWSGEDTARVRYEGDSRYIQYEKRFWGMEFCEVWYKNPRGTPERKNEYVAFGDLGMYTFSPVR